ncbi:unnamed protein product [Ascophyllum nodosum]
MRDLEAMDPRQPYSVKLLGEAMVVWKEPRGGWRVFADRCPHRWAPLSEGRVDQETGRLQCIYHGWEFEADGGCGNIPQVAPEVRDTAQSSKRACATVIPSRVEHGLLWVWPDASPEGVESSERASPVCVPEMDSPDFGGEWYVRDLPYGYDTLVENLVDPAHVPYAHHGVIGARPMGTPMAIAMEKGLGEDVLRTQQTGYAGSKNMVVGYDAPSLVFYRSDYTDLWQGMAKSRLFIRCLAWIVTTFKLDKRLAMKPEERKSASDRLYAMFIGYAVPTSPGKSRIFIRNSRNFLLQHPVIPRRWRNSLASEHVRQHLVLDGDTPAVHMQERFLLKAGKHGGASAERTYFMPADSDEPIRAFRKWYNSRGGGGPAWVEGVDPSDLGPILPRERLLERMSGHTKHCSACSKAYRVSGQVKRASVGGALFLIASAAVAPRGPLALCLAGAAVAASGKNDIIYIYIYTEYITYIYTRVYVCGNGCGNTVQAVL